MNLEHILWEICVKGPKRVFNGGHVIKSGTYALQIAEFDQMRNPQNAEKCDKTNILCIRLGFFVPTVITLRLLFFVTKR